MIALQNTVALSEKKNTYNQYNHKKYKQSFIRDLQY